MTESLTQKTIHGLKWSYISTISTAIMQVGYTAVMSRILNPSDFGLVAMGGVILRFGQYFAQMGIGSAIIQKKDLTKENISASFTSSVFLGILFTVLTIILAPLAKYVFKNNDVVPILRLMGLSFAINGFSLTALALVRRNMNFKFLAISEIIAFVVGYLVIGIGSAVIGFGVWSLAYASLSQSLILAVLTFLIIRHDVSLTFSWVHYKPLISFGSKVSVISFLEFIGSSLDTILIGRYFGDIKLGFYNRAQMLINLPMQYFTTSFSRVLFPSFSQIQDDNERIKKNIFLILKIVATVLFPFAIFVSILAKEIVYVILGNKWMESAVLLQVLAFAAAINLLSHFIAVLFEAQGLLKEKIFVQSLFIVVLAVSFYIVLPYGVLGFTLALLFSQTFKLLQYFFYFLRILKVTISEIFKNLFQAFVTAFLFWAVLFPLYHLTISISDNNFLILSICTFISLASYLLILLLKYNTDIRNKLKFIIVSLKI
ncbi:MAG: lipopolysaccharide biosynthesis protein [Melioribacteraceae bacterium]